MCSVFINLSMCLTCFLSLFTCFLSFSSSHALCFSFFCIQLQSGATALSPQAMAPIAEADVSNGEDCVVHLIERREKKNPFLSLSLSLSLFMWSFFPLSTSIHTYLSLLTLFFSFFLPLSPPPGGNSAHCKRKRLVHNGRSRLQPLSHRKHSVSGCVYSFVYCLYCFGGLGGLVVVNGDFVEHIHVYQRFFLPHSICMYLFGISLLTSCYGTTVDEEKDAQGRRFHLDRTGMRVYRAADVVLAHRLSRQKSRSSKGCASQ